MLNATYPAITNDEELKDAIIEVLDSNSRIEDFGIGPYECWGFRGNDVQMGIELDVDEVEVDVSTLDDETIAEDDDLQEVRGVLEKGSTELSWIARISGMRNEGELKIATYEIEVE